MKRILKRTLRFTVIKTLCLVVVTLFATFGCDKSENLPINETNPLQGTKWKLIEVSIAKDYQESEVIDYSEKNIIYEFQGSHKLVIVGNIGDLFIFDDFKVGEHFYEYSNPNVCQTCLPEKNLSIDKPQLGQEDGHYYCSVDLDNRTMRIGGDKIIRGVVDETDLMSGENFYNWSKTFIKLN